MIPDRLCADSASQFFIKDHPMVRVSVDGVEYTGRVLEYCISSGWAKIITLGPDGKAVASVRGGRASCKMKHGTVVVWLASDPIPPGAITPGTEAPTVQHVLPSNEAAP